MLLRWTLGIYRDWLDQPLVATQDTADKTVTKFKIIDDKKMSV